MIKTKVLRRALSLRKDGLSDEICIKVILDLCRDVRDPDQTTACSTIVAFMEDRYAFYRELIRQRKGESNE